MSYVSVKYTENTTQCLIIWFRGVFDHISYHFQGHCHYLKSLTGMYSIGTHKRLSSQKKSWHLGSTFMSYGRVKYAVNTAKCLIIWFWGVLTTFMTIFKVTTFILRLDLIYILWVLINNHQNLEIYNLWIPHSWVIVMQNMLKRPHSVN